MSPSSIPASNATDSPDAAPCATSPSASPDSVVRLSSASLLQGQREVEIVHTGMVYRLRETAMGKLILTK
jgi:hemin uptake protein HemP